MRTRVRCAATTRFVRSKNFLLHVYVPGLINLNNESILAILRQYVLLAISREIANALARREFARTAAPWIFKKQRCIPTNKLRAIACILLCLLLCGCTQIPIQEAPAASPEYCPSPTPEPPAPRVEFIEFIADPLVDAADSVNPFARINPNTFAIYNPNRELYNALYQAAYAHKPSLDISGFDLTDGEKTAAAESLYGACGFELFDLDRIKLSNDSNTVKFRYLDMDDNTIVKNRETLFARLSHLENNVVLENYTDMQKLIAVYRFICENSDYSSDMEDYTTFTPYGILVKGQGICGGYAMLMQYALTRLGLTVEYVCTEAHAWNVVKLNGNYYHTDATWGAGNEWDKRNNSRYLFMDDSLRKESLINSGYPADPIILGYPGGGRGAPPACTDTSLNSYTDSFCSAFDIEHNTAYISDADSIDAMNLDCTNRRTLIQGDSCYAMAYFDEMLYYISTNDGYLYRLAPEGSKELLDDSGSFWYLEQKGATLYYGADASGAGIKSIPLLTLPEETKTAAMLEDTSVPRSRSFSIRIQFSLPMAEVQDWNKAVYLTDDAGNALPCSFSYDKTNSTLTLRPLCYVDGYSIMSVYVTAGAKAQTGKATCECVGRQAELLSEAGQAANSKDEAA